MRHARPTLPQAPQAVVRDKKAGNAYSAAGDDDINDVAAMGGVNLAEEANVGFMDLFRAFSLDLLS